MLGEQSATAEKTVRQADEIIKETESRLVAMCSEARCAGAAELPAAEERAEHRARLAAQIAGLEKQLRALSAAQPLDEFIGEVRAVDPDTIRTDLLRLNDDIARLDRELKDELGPRIGAQRSLLEQMDRGAAAADAADDVQDLLAKIAVDADEYARLRLTLFALRKGIERYRERHQGPIFKRASRHFAQLTCAAFSGLREDYDSDGTPELVGVRAADGKLVRTKEMSDGTADQLYLAVRWPGSRSISRAMKRFRSSSTTS